MILPSCVTSYGSGLKVLRTAFYQELGVKCRRRSFGTLLVLNHESRKGHASILSLLKDDWKHLFPCMPSPTSGLKVLRTTFHQRVEVKCRHRSFVTLFYSGTIVGIVTPAPVSSVDSVDGFNLCVTSPTSRLMEL